MTRGPQPTPTSLKVLRGNPGKRALNRREPKPAAGGLRCPAFLDVEARREWRRLLPRLRALGLATEIDGGLLAAYCAAYARWARAELMIAQYGEVQVTPNKFMQPSPYVTIARQSMQLLDRLGSHFGLSPASRARVSATPPPLSPSPPGESTLARFLRTGE